MLQRRAGKIDRILVIPLPRRLASGKADILHHPGAILTLHQSDLSMSARHIYRSRLCAQTDSRISLHPGAVRRRKNKARQPAELPRSVRQLYLGAIPRRPFAASERAPGLTAFISLRLPGIPTPVQASPLHSVRLIDPRHDSTTDL